MDKVKFEYHRVNSRKDLLHFVEQYGDKQVYEHIGENPLIWIDELNILSQILTQGSLIGGIGLNQPPINEPDFTELGNGAFLYRGVYDRLRGLWIRENKGKDLEGMTKDSFEWIHYHIGTRAKLMINQEFSSVPPKQFLPENFEPISSPINKEKGLNKRPLATFTINMHGKEIKIYAKGSDVSFSYYSGMSKP